MAATASIEIVVNDSQATAAINRLDAANARIGATLQPVQRISEQTFNNIEGGALKARESAALLGEEFGVKIPRALRGVQMAGALMWVVYGALIGASPVIVANVLVFGAAAWTVTTARRVPRSATEQID